MAVVKAHLAPGKYVAQGRPVEINAKTSKAYSDKFRALKAQGERFGVPWGHFEECSPSAKQFLSSRFNAGYLQDLIVGPDGGLDVVLDCEGVSQGPNGKLLAHAELPDGTKVKTEIREVSPGIWDEWTDGKGVTHTNLIGHVALAMNPVVANQPGFTALSTLPANGKILYLSSTVVADDEEKKTDDEPKVELPDTSDASETPDPIDLVQQTSDQMKRILSLLAEAGMALPSDTTEDNFLDRIETALGVLLQMVAKMKADHAAAAEAKPTEAPLVEEGNPSGGVMMSTLSSRLDKLEADNKKLRRALTKTFLSTMVRTTAHGLPVDQPTMVTIKTAHGSMTVTKEQAEELAAQRK